MYILSRRTTLRARIPDAKYKSSNIEISPNVLLPEKRSIVAKFVGGARLRRLIYRRGLPLLRERGGKRGVRTRNAKGESGGTGERKVLMASRAYTLGECFGWRINNNHAICSRGATREFASHALIGSLSRFPPPLVKQRTGDGDAENTRRPGSVPKWMRWLSLEGGTVLSLAGRNVSHYSRMTTGRRRRRRTVDECDFDSVAMRGSAVVASDSFALAVMSRHSREPKS